MVQSKRSVNFMSIIYILIIFSITTFLLSEFNIFKMLDELFSSIYNYINSGFSTKNPQLAMGRVSLFFYFILMSSFVVLEYTSKKIKEKGPVDNNFTIGNIIILILLVLSLIYLLSEAYSKNLIITVNIFSLIIIGLAYTLSIELFKMIFPKNKEKSDDAESDKISLNA